MWLQSVQYDLQHDFAWVTDEADRSVVLALLLVVFFGSVKYYRKKLRISYKNHVTNEEVRAKIQHAIGPYEDLQTIVKRRKLQWYGHASRSSDLAEEDKADRGRGGKTTSGNGQAWSSPSPRGKWRTGKMEETGCEIIRGAPTTLTVKG